MRKLLILLLAMLIISEHASACTIFYINRNGMVLGGINEDWKDPYIKFWIYPAENGKNAWIKFGFGGGYPQGGMNSHGLFWDATACTWLAMPEAEKNKQEFQGALMQKVMEECGSVEEAIIIFGEYYCQDQYRAQYLLGDSTGHSMIVEGDNIILNDTAFQVLTNFYQSNPELGGYPCSRYETAVKLLGESDESNTYLAGTVLAYTHQEGNDPTQYSNIYELQKCLVHLFYYHNYQEYLSIDLIKESMKGAASYDIPQLFSKIQSMETRSEKNTAAHTVSLHWHGLEDSNYEILYADNPSFNNSKTVRVNITAINPPDHTTILALVPAGLLVLLLGVKKKKSFRYLLFFVIIITAGFQCNREDKDNKVNEGAELSCELSSLKPGTTYYWKIRAKTESSDFFRTESLVNTFSTQAD